MMGAQAASAATGAEAEDVVERTETGGASTPPPATPQLREEPPVADHSRRALMVIDNREPRWKEAVPVASFIVVALAWVALITWAALDASNGARPTAPFVASWASTACTPLILIAIAYMLWQRTSRREAGRFARTAEAMRQESQRLESVLAQIAVRTENHRAAVAAQASQLLQLGDEASNRLAGISEAMRQNTSALAKQAARLDSSAEAARKDMGVLLADLPNAEAQATALAETLKSVGAAALVQIQGLEGQFAGLSERGTEANALAEGGAKALAARIAEIEGAGVSASEKLDATATAMTAAIDTAIAHAAEAFDQSRKGMDSQAAAMVAMAEQSEAALARTGVDAAAAMARRVEEISGHIEQLSAKLSAQDAASQTLVSAVARSLEDLDARFQAVAETGSTRSDALGSALAKLGSDVQALSAAIGSGDAATVALLDRAGALRSSLDACIVEIDERMPIALDKVEAQARQSRAVVEAAAPEVERIEASARGAAEALAAAEATLARQQQAMAALLDTIDSRIADAQAHAGALEQAIGGADDRARSLVEGSAAQLVESLARVREVGIQAAERAREALGSVIPESAAAMGEAGRNAMRSALTDEVQTQIGQISAQSERAVEAARNATERLMRQMLTIAETTSAIEGRIVEAREEVAKADSDSFSRRVALLIESLNSTAIDVTKILSNDVTDAAWASYLKGDRGIFTRRAVKLIDAGEAREITRHYESDPEFREQVNRYIHDFEAMLRDVLANRDGTPLGVTILSSDMGKLYVALAQAIERLRA